MQEQKDFFNCKRIVRAYQKRIEEMEQRIEELLEKTLMVDELKRQVKVLEGHLSDTEGKLEDAEKQVRSLRGELHEATQSNASLEDHIRRLQAHMDSLNDDLDEKDKALRQLIRKLADEIHARKTAEDRTAGLEVENRELAEANSHLERKAIKSENEAQAWRENYEAANLEVLTLGGKMQNLVDNIQVYMDSAAEQLEELEKRYENIEEMDPLPGQGPDLVNIGRYQEILRIGQNIIDRLS